MVVVTGDAEERSAVEDAAAADNDTVISSAHYVNNDLLQQGGKGVDLLPNEQNDTNNNVSSAVASTSTEWWTRTRVLILGQIVSFFLTCAGAAQATLHLECHLSAPTFSTGVVYFLLSLLLIPHVVGAWRKRSGGEQYRSAIATTTSDREYASRQHDDTTKASPPSPFLYGATSFLHEGRIYSETQKEEEDMKITTAELPPNAAAMKSRYSLGPFVPLHAPVWAYFFIALLDVEANYLTVMAFKYTTLLSVNVFDAFTIPSAMLLSKLFLRRSYVWAHIAGAIVCMTGIAMNVWSDYRSDQSEVNEDDKQQDYPHKVWGDVLAICGGILWGLNNVVQELVIKSTGGPVEVLGMIGFFGTLISIVQVILFERDDMFIFNASASSCSPGVSFLLLLGYALPVVFTYVGGAYFLLVSESTLYNLSMLTSDLWTVFFSVVAEHIIPAPLFFVALILVVSGVVLYETGPSPIVIDDQDKSMQANEALIHEHELQQLGKTNKEDYPVVVLAPTAEFT